MVDIVDVFRGTLDATLASRADARARGDVKQQIIEGANTGQDLGRILSGQPTQGQEIKDAETRRFLETANFESVVRGAIKAASITNPQQRQAFLLDRIGEIKARGGDPRDSIELFNMPFEQQNEALANTLDLGERVGVLKPRAGGAAQFSSVQQTPSGPIGIRQGRVEVIPQGPGVAEALGAVRSLKDVEKDLKATKATFDRSKVIRGELVKATNEFNAITNSFDRILAVTKDPSAAGDLALIFNFMKMLDPGSVVRESEFATAANSAGVPERVRAQWNRMQEGERLSPKTRADFIQQARNLFTSSQGRHKIRQKGFVKLGKRFGLEREDIVVPQGGELGIQPAPSGTQPQGGSAQTLSDEELMRALQEGQ